MLHDGYSLPFNIERAINKTVSNRVVIFFLETVQMEIVQSKNTDTIAFHSYFGSCSVDLPRMIFALAGVSEQEVAKRQTGNFLEYWLRRLTSENIGR